MEEYDVIEIKGKHGMINLHIPKKEPTKDEIKDVYEAVATIALNNRKKPAE